MVHELFVLLGIQDLQQGGRRVSPVIRTDLVDFIKQEHGVVALALPDGGHDAAGDRADIGPSVAADLRLVPYTAQGHVDELAPGGPGYGSCDGGLSYPRRPYQTEDGALLVFGEGEDGQVFHDTLLDLVQAVVVLVQDLLAFLKIDVLLGGLVPGKVEDPLDIGPYDGKIRSVRRQLRRPVDLLFDLFGDLGAELELLQLLLPLLGLGLDIVVLAQFLLDGAHLLHQVVLPLGFVQVVLELGVQLVLVGLDLVLAGKISDHQGQPLDRIHGHQDLLGLFGEDVHLGDDEISDVTGLVVPLKALEIVVGEALMVGPVLGIEIRGGPDQREDVGSEGHVVRLFDLLKLADEIRGLPDHLFHSGAVLAGHQDPQLLSRQPQDPLDPRDRAYGIKILRRGKIHRGILLIGEEYEGIAVHGRLKGLDGLVPLYVETDLSAREHADASQGYQRHGLGLDLFVH